MTPEKASVPIRLADFMLKNFFAPYLKELAQKIGPEDPDRFVLSTHERTSRFITDPTRILFLSDLHLGAHYTDQNAVASLVYKMSNILQDPKFCNHKTVIIFGGDDVTESMGEKYPGTTMDEYSHFHFFSHGSISCFKSALPTKHFPKIPVKKGSISLFDTPNSF